MATQLKINYQPKQVWGFVEDLGGVSVDMILIPPGTFMMGASKEEEESLDRERPQREVTVSTFFMGRYPITQAQWKFVVNLPQIERKLKPDPSRFKGDKRPVEKVSWYDAIEFCARLCRHSGKPYRLASEAEWEYACRAGTRTPFHFGKTIGTDLANYNGADEKYGAYGRGVRGEYRQGTTDVDYFKGTNLFGLSGMHGNVLEWCLDPWHNSYQDAPKDGRVWDEGSNDNRYQNILDNINVLLEYKRSRVFRGGSWFDNPRYCRSAYRNLNDPAYVFHFIGFRVVCGLPSAP